MTHISARRPLVQAVAWNGSAEVGRLQTGARAGLGQPGREQGQNGTHPAAQAGPVLDRTGGVPGTHSPPRGGRT